MHLYHRGVGESCSRRLSRRPTKPEGFLLSRTGTVAQAALWATSTHCTSFTLTVVGPAAPAAGMKKAPGRRVHDQDHQSARSFRVLVYPSGIDLSSRTLRHLSGLLAGHRRRIGSCWRRLTCGRQAMLVLAHLRCGDTYARLTAGFRIGIATAYRYIREAVDLLAALAPTLEQAMTTVRKKAYVILDGSVLPIDRIAADRPYYSGKKKHHGMNVQVSPIPPDA